MKKEYLFSLDYNKRIGEKPFIKDILDNYDANELIASKMYVNNYKQKMLLHLSFKGDITEFEKWLNENYPSKSQYKGTIEGSTFTHFMSKGYNIKSVHTSKDVDTVITKQPNSIFLLSSTD